MLTEIVLQYCRDGTKAYPGSGLLSTLFSITRIDRFQNFSLTSHRIQNNNRRGVSLNFGMLKSVIMAGRYILFAPCYFLSSET